MPTIWRQTLEEQKIAHAQDRVVALQKASAAGENVLEPLRTAEAEFEELRKNLPRGSLQGYCLLGFFITITVWTIYGIAFNSELLELWGSPAHPYLQQHRTDVAFVWQTCQTLSDSNWLVIGAMSFLGVLAIVQRRMVRRSARMLLCGLILTVLLLDAVLVVAYFQLLFFPLGLNY